MAPFFSLDFFLRGTILAPKRRVDQDSGCIVLQEVRCVVRRGVIPLAQAPARCRTDTCPNAELLNNRMTPQARPYS